MKTSLDPRHLRREKIVQELFAWQEQQKLKSTPTDEQIADKKEWDEKTKAVIALKSEIDEIIEICAPEWSIDKINEIDLAILRLAVYELVFEAIEPTKVVVDEAVELAKAFGNDNSSSFVNGALGKALTSPKRIIRLIANKTGVDEARLTPDMLLRDLNITDLELNDLFVGLEHDLQIPLPGKNQFKTVGEILEYIEDNQD